MQWKSLTGEFGIIRSFFYNNFIAYALVYLQSFLINKFMPMESLGKFSYSQSLFLLFTSVLSMEVYSAYLRYIGFCNEEKLLHLVRKILLIASALFSIIVILWFDSPFYVLFAGYMWMRERLYFFRSHLDISTYGRIKICQCLISIFIFFGLLFFGMLDHRSMLIGIGISYVFVSVLYSLHERGRTTNFVSNDLPVADTKEIIRYALPLSFNAIVVWVLGAADQMLINAYLDPLTLTYYSVSFRIIGVIRIGTGVLMEYWPRFYFENMERQNFSAVKSMETIFLGVATGLCVMAIVFSKPIYIALGASRYVDSRWMFCALAVAEMFRLWGAVLMTFSSFQKDTVTNIVCLSILSFGKFGINYFSIENRGVEILFYTTIACYFLYFTLAIYFGFKRERYYMQQKG